MIINDNLNYYIFTWISKSLSHEKLVELVSQFQKNEEVEFYWRCANRNAPIGSKAIFLSQEPKHRGIFGLGTIFDSPKKMNDTVPGKLSFRAGIKFDQISDPLVKIFIDYADLVKFPIDGHVISSDQTHRQWRPRSSGEKLNAKAALEIIKKVLPNSDLEQKSDFNIEEFNPEKIIDSREKIIGGIFLRRGQALFRKNIMDAYQNSCAITDCKVVELLEAAHIFPYLGKETNSVQNGILLRTDIHTLFDCGLITIDPVSMKVIISKNLNDDFYKNIAGRNIKLPINRSQHPSKNALLAHASKYRT